MLTISDLTVCYGQLTAVDSVDLRVDDGTVLALLGPSGCGKSTLLRAVAGLEPIRGGRAEWDGVNLASIPVHRRGFGLMFQDGVLFPHRSVSGNVGYGLRFSGLSGREISARVDELLELVGLGGYGPRRVATLSGGEAQRVALARALAPQPRLLLLDEPLAALDRSLRDRLLTDLRTVLVQTGTTALFVTHDQDEAFAIADRVALMRAGAVVQAGDPREVWSHPADEWVARFVGYTSVLPGRAAPDSGFTTTALGVVPGVGDLVALRPSALVLDSAGPIRGRCTAVTPAPDELRLTVSVAGVGGLGVVALGAAAVEAAAVEAAAVRAAAAGADDVAVPDGPDDGVGTLELGEVRAVAEPGVLVAVGDYVRLRLDPSGTAVIGAGAATGAVEESAADAEHTVSVR